MRHDDRTAHYLSRYERGFLTYLEQAPLLRSACPKGPT